MPPKGTKHVQYTWTAEAERIIVLTALKNATFEPSRDFYESVVQNLGGGVTVNAVSQRFYKLKKESEALTNGMATSPSTDPNDPASATTTPAKKPRARAATSSAKRKTKADDDAEDNEKDTEETPSKKPRAPRKSVPKKSSVKVEVKDEGNDAEPESNGKGDEVVAAEDDIEIEVVSADADT